MRPPNDTKRAHPAAKPGAPSFSIVAPGVRLLREWQERGEHPKSLALARRLRELSPDDEELIALEAASVEALEGRAVAATLLAHEVRRLETKRGVSPAGLARRLWALENASQRAS